MKEESMYDYADEISTLSTDDIFSRIVFQKMDKDLRKYIKGQTMIYARRKCREQRLICQKDFEQGSVKIRNSILPVIE